jgi:hypothetical protein
MKTSAVCLKNNQHIATVNPLNMSGDYIYHVLYQLVTLHFYLWVLYGSQCKEHLFP